MMAGTEIYVAGYPLGDPEYMLTEGILSKEDADGDTSWASIDSVIEHTARAMGNSGGPLVTDEGRVLGVHYASVGDLDLRYAISREEAVKVLDEAWSLGREDRRWARWDSNPQHSD